MHRDINAETHITTLINASAFANTTTDLPKNPNIKSNVQIRSKTNANTSTIANNNVSVNINSYADGNSGSTKTNQNTTISFNASTPILRLRRVLILILLPVWLFPKIADLFWDFS